MSQRRGSRSRRGLVGQGPRRREFPGRLAADPPATAPHVHAFYAFARNADDIADSAVLAPDDKIARLDVMEAVLLGQADDRRPERRALRAQPGRDRRDAAPFATDLLIAFRRTRPSCATRAGTSCSITAAIPPCRSAAMCSICTARMPPRTRRRTRCARRCRCSTICRIARRISRALDRCYLPLDLLAQTGSTVADVLRRRAETPGLRRVFDRLLDRCDALNRAALDLPRRTRDRRLRLETAVIVGLPRRLAQPPAPRRPARHAGEAAQDATWPAACSPRWRFLP